MTCASACAGWKGHLGSARRRLRDLNLATERGNRGIHRSAGHERYSSCHREGGLEAKVITQEFASKA